MSLLEKLLSPSVPSDKILYHYTTQDGLLGILKSKQLWVSSIRHLNDAAEFNYTTAFVRDTVTLKFFQETGPLNAFYGAVLDGLERLAAMTLYVGSFSQNGDVLSQWRAYTHSGIGFSLGFEYEYLRALAEAQHYQFLRCNYDETEHRQVIAQLMDEASRMVNTHEPHAVQLAISFFYDRLIKLAAVLKHPSFAEEKEWRLISEPAFRHVEQAFFRPGKSMLVPFRSFDLTTEDRGMEMPVLYVGPTPHMELSRYSVGQLVSIAQIGDSDIRPSVVPFRSW